MWLLLLLAVIVAGCTALGAAIAWSGRGAVVGLAIGIALDAIVVYAIAKAFMVPIR